MHENPPESPCVLGKPAIEKAGVLGASGKHETAEMALITVWSSFTASHLCAEAEPHVHRWEVEAAFRVRRHTDARCYLAMLDAMCANWEGKQLPPEIEWNEDIARAVGSLVNCVRVVVKRDRERMGAEWPVPEALR
jgi:hypothetical protein